MHLRSKAAIVLSLLTMQCFAAPAVQSLCGEGWQMKQVRGHSWYPASVPGTVHTDLIAAGIIDDPYFGFNERAVQWVDKEDWLYVRTFDVSDEILSCGKVDLCFDGLDTYADVRLNGKLILEADNMFRRWRSDVTDLLVRSGNRLEVFFHSPIKEGLALLEKSPVTYYATNDQSANGGLFGKRVSVFTRKAGYHYGWDWGPRIVTSGIWRNVCLEAWNGARLKDVFYRQKNVNVKKAELEAIIEIEADCDMPGVSISVSADGVSVVRVKKDLNKGINLFSIPFSIAKPHLWWSRGLGEPYLYSLRTEVSAEGRLLDSDTERTGLRSIHLKRDVPGAAGRFCFELNGIPVFMKGANYIPNDIFLPRVGRDEYERVVSSAADAGMNMLRVWGGGIYEDDCFYDLCDEAGILIWQDFMFACSMYPYEGRLRESILAEAEDNIRRLRNHPCIALWCGNNECSSMWYTWGVQSGNKEKDRITIEQYDRQYFTDLPAEVAQFSPETDYLPTSPMMEKGGGEKKWDLHDWTAWSKADPLLFESTQAPFYSEYGFQSFACTETAAQFAPDSSSWGIDSEMMMFHQRGGVTANSRMMKTLQKFYRLPADYAEAAYLSQICQADAVKSAIEHHRRGKPVTWGSLYWQINDCWPVASWSSRDWYGTWKALHYAVRDAYREVLPSFSISENEVAVWVCSDLLSSCRGKLDVAFETYDGRIVFRERLKLKLGANSSTKIKIYDISSFGATPEEMFVKAVFTTEDGVTVRNHRMLTSMKDAVLPGSKVDYRVKQADGAYEIELSSEKFAKGVFLNVEGAMLRKDSSGRALAGNGAARNFSDNYFDILPGETVMVKIESDLSPREFERKLVVHSL